MKAGYLKDKKSLKQNQVLLQAIMRVNHFQPVKLFRKLNGLNLASSHNR
jgi:hypothetical protein